jgi:polysaccharide biosynthesis protein PelF
MLTTEGTYPFHKGGVSTWCHVLTQRLSEVDFKLYALVANPYLPQRYELSPNVRQVVKVPLWGTEDPVEFSWRFPFSEALKSKIDATQSAIAKRFVPLFERFLQAVLFGESDMECLGRLLVGMHEYFLRYDYYKTMKSELVYSTFVRLVLDNWQQQYDRDSLTLVELTEALRLLYHFLIPLHLPIPEADLNHSSAAAFCGLPCVIAKIQRGTPYMLTEHGINIREQYLNLNRSIDSPFVCLFLYRLMAAVVKLNYHFADCIAPVCEYNSRWEKWWGVPNEKIKVIYNGVDPDKFHPTEPVEKERPLVMNIGLIFPLKGQLDLIEAAAIVRDRIPNVEFRFYGKASDEEYFAECQKRVRDYQIEDNINFAGFTSEPWRVYSEADVVAMASISEGFPFAIVEAMLSGATIVSTDVGGVSEALGDTGLLVQANRPQELARAILKLLELPKEEREKFGRMARDRALKLFTEKHFLEEHLNTYRKLCDRHISDQRDS